MKELTLKNQVKVKFVEITKESVALEISIMNGNCYTIHLTKEELKKVINSIPINLNEEQ